MSVPQLQYGRPRVLVAEVAALSMAHTPEAPTLSRFPFMHCMHARYVLASLRPLVTTRDTHAETARLLYCREQKGLCHTLWTNSFVSDDHQSTSQTQQARNLTRFHLVCGYSITSTSLSFRKLRYCTPAAVVTGGRGTSR